MLRRGRQLRRRRHQQQAGLGAALLAAGLGAVALLGAALPGRGGGTARLGPATTPAATRATAPTAGPPADAAASPDVSLLSGEWDAGSAPGEHPGTLLVLGGSRGTQLRWGCGVLEGGFSAEPGGMLAADLESGSSACYAAGTTTAPWLQAAAGFCHRDQPHPP